MSTTSPDLVSLVGNYVTLTKSRRGFRGRCPFHTDVAESLLISPEKGLFKCFGCGKEGGTAEFKQAIAQMV